MIYKKSTIQLVSWILFLTEVILLSYIKSVVPKENYHLEVNLDNGSSIILNLENKLGTVRFGMLADNHFFHRATTDGVNIKWDNKIEISINEVFLLAQK